MHSVLKLKNQQGWFLLLRDFLSWIYQHVETVDISTFLIPAGVTVDATAFFLGVIVDSTAFFLGGVSFPLPFTSLSANHRSAGSLWTYNGPIPEKSNQWLVQSNTSHASFWKLRDNQTSPTMQWDNGTEIVLSIAYFTSQ